MLRRQNMSDKRNRIIGFILVAVVLLSCLAFEAFCERQQERTADYGERIESRPVAEPAKQIASEFQAAGRRVPYGNWQPLLYESVVRSSVVSYLKSKTSRRAAWWQLRADKRLGFRWLPQLCDLLDGCEANRDKYPTFKLFLPRIVGFMTNYELARADNHMRRVARA